MFGLFRRKKARARTPAKRLAPRGLNLTLEELEIRNLLSSPTNPIVAPHLTNPTPSGFSPSQIRHAYGLDQVAFGNGAIKADGTGQTIAIVDAYDNPNILSDLHTFDQTFGLPDPPNFTKVDKNGGTNYPPADAAWAEEIAMDVEWAHAIAPGANILLVETAADENSMMAGVDYARSSPGVVAVSMSWGVGEFNGETAYDSHFATPGGHGGVTFVASAGDSGAVPQWPAVSPNVVTVGGSVLTLDGSGNYAGESAWSNGGGGISAYEAKPGFQNGVNPTGVRRAAPDVAYNTASFSVYCSMPVGGQSGWFSAGGTSAGAPQWAALIAIADQGRALNGQGSLDGTSATLPMLYNLSGSDFHDITSGSNGNPATGGYDLVTGRGTPYVPNLIRDMVGGGTAAPTTSAPTQQTTSQTTSSRSAAPAQSQLPPDTTNSTTLATVNGPQGPVTFVIGSNQALYRFDRSGWNRLSEPGRFSHLSAVVEASGNVVVFGVTNDLGLARFDSASGWSWISKPGTVQSMSAGTDRYGQADVFAIATDQATYEYTRQTGWFGIASPGSIRTVEAGSQERLETIAFDGSVLQHGPSGWIRLSDHGFGRSLSAVTDAFGNQVVFVIGTDQSLFRHDGSGWKQLNIAGTMQSIGAGVDATGHANVYAVTTLNTLSEYSDALGWHSLAGFGSAIRIGAARNHTFTIANGAHTMVEYSDATGWMALTGSGFAL